MSSQNQKPFFAPIGGNFKRPLSSPYRMPRGRPSGGPIWTVLGLTKHAWQLALQSAQFFAKSHLAALDEIGARQLNAGLHEAWGADYDRNEREARWFLNDSGEQFFQARDDEGHAFRYMPMYWETALAASQQPRTVDPVRKIHRMIHPADAR